jgi:hypothetical protein
MDMTVAQMGHHVALPIPGLKGRKPTTRLPSSLSHRPSTYFARIYSAISLRKPASATTAFLYISLQDATHWSVGRALSGFRSSQNALPRSFPHSRAETIDSGFQTSKSTERGLEIWVPRLRWMPTHRIHKNMTMGTSRRPVEDEQHTSHLDSFRLTQRGPPG